MRSNKEMAPDEDKKYEAFVSQLSRHEPDIRAFVRTLVPSWTDADEVVQQVALVAWRKFDQFDPDTSFIKWACVIARFEALTYRRRMARDRLVFNEELLSQIAEEGAQELDIRVQERRALEKCLKELPERNREFITLAYTPGISQLDLAKRAGVRPGAFYMRLNRIRAKLLKCIQTNLAPSEP